MTYFGDVCTELDMIFNSAFFMKWYCSGQLEFSLLEGINEAEALEVWKGAQALFSVTDKKLVANYLSPRFQVIRNLIVAEKMK